MTAQRCTQPGCTGTILDGYCDVCGSPASVSGGASAVGSNAVPGAGASSSPSAAGSSGPAALPRMPPVPSVPGAASASPVSASPSSRSAVTSSSNRLASAPIGSVAGPGHPGHPTGRDLVDPAARRPARRRAHHGPADARDRPATSRCMHEPAGARGPAVLPELRQAGRPLPGRPPRPDRGLLPEVPQRRSPSPRSCSAGRPGRRPVRGRRLPRPRRPRLDLPRPRPERLRPLGGAQGPAQLRRPRRARRGGRRAAVPRPGRAPAHRRDLQLRAPRGRRLHRHGVRRRDRHSRRSSRTGCAPTGGRYDPIPVDQAIAYIVEILPAFQYLHDLGLLYCDFKPDNIIQVGDAVKLIDLGGVRRIDDLDSAIYGTVGYQAPEVPEVGPVDRLGHLHDRPHPGRAGHGVPRLPVDLRRVACPPVADVPLFQRYDSLYRLLRQGLRARPGRPVPVRGRAARAAARACCARSSPPTGRSPASRCTRRRRCSSRRPSVTGGRPRLAAPAGAPGRPGRPDGGLAGRASRRPTPPPGSRRCTTAPERDRRGAARAGPGPRSRRAASTSRTTTDRERARRGPLGVAGGLAAGSGGPARKNDPTRPGRPSTPSTGRCPASWRRSSPSPSPARRAASPTSPRRCTRCAPAPTPTTPRPPRSGWPGSAPARGDLDGALAALDLVPVDEPGLRRGPAAAGRSARGVRARPAQRCRTRWRSIESVTIDPLDRARLTATCSAPRSTTVIADGEHPTLRIAGHPATEPRSARRARGGLP